MAEPARRNPLFDARARDDGRRACGHHRVDDELAHVEGRGGQHGARQAQAAASTVRSARRGASRARRGGTAGAGCAACRGARGRDVAGSKSRRETTPRVAVGRRRRSWSLLRGIVRRRQPACRRVKGGSDSRAAALSIPSAGGVLHPLSGCSHRRTSFRLTTVSQGIPDQCRGRYPDIRPMAGQARSAHNELERVTHLLKGATWSDSCGPLAPRWPSRSSPCSAPSSRSRS